MAYIFEKKEKIDRNEEISMSVLSKFPVTMYKKERNRVTGKHKYRLSKKKVCTYIFTKYLLRSKYAFQNRVILSFKTAFPSSSLLPLY